ncbi:uncharacterized protein apol [Polymixia lowei]
MERQKESHVKRKTRRSGRARHQQRIMSVSREQLQKDLCLYISDTLSHIDVVREFCDKLPKWMLGRETEINMMTDIKERADQIDPKFDQVTKSEDKAKALGEYMKSWFTGMTADRRREELVKELDTVLEDTLKGLEKLDYFLDAVEKLAVTSLHVFMESNQVLQSSLGINLEGVQAVITAARLVCPLLLQFKRHASVFFLPSLNNVEVLVFQLAKYIYITQKICEKIDKSSVTDFGQKLTKTTVGFAGDLSEDDTQSLLCHINQLVAIRMGQDCRLMFLFQEESHSGFIKEFSERQPRMLQFLTDLEENAVQLDRMKQGAQISSVAGSSVGAVGGILSIVGLALIPVTLGASLALTLTGVGLGVTSGVNSLVTTVTEISVNSTQQKKAKEVFENFMKDVESVQKCLEPVSSQKAAILGENDVDVDVEVAIGVGVGKVLAKASTIGKGIDSIVDAASAMKVLKSEELITSVGKVALQEGKAVRNVPRVASEIPDIGQAAAKGALGMSTAARAGLITANALFLGLDIFFICKDSIGLAKGSKSEVSQFIRDRAALWCSELGSWQKIHDSLCRAMLESEKNQSILERRFYPVRDKK